MIVEKMQYAVHGIMHAIHQHPFISGLSTGVLPRDTFIFYLVQDALYLADFSRALALTAAKLPNNEHVQQFIAFALDAMKAERELHFGYIQAYRASINPSIDLMAQQSPACFTYTHYLLKMACLAPVEEAVSSLLPCFLIYQEVGKKLASQSLPNNPYHDWIALYSSEAFELSIRTATNITNELAYQASKSTQENMISAFVRSTQLEWMFWESAYRQENWLIQRPSAALETRNC